MRQRILLNYTTTSGASHIVALIVCQLLHMVSGSIPNAASSTSSVSSALTTPKYIDSCEELSCIASTDDEHHRDSPLSAAIDAVESKVRTDWMIKKLTTPTKSQNDHHRHPFLTYKDKGAATRQASDFPREFEVSEQRDWPTGSTLLRSRFDDDEVNSLVEPSNTWDDAMIGSSGDDPPDTSKETVTTAFCCSIPERQVASEELTETVRGQHDDDDDTIHWQQSSFGYSIDETMLLTSLSHPMVGIPTSTTSGSTCTSTNARSSCALQLAPTVSQDPPSPPSGDNNITPAAAAICTTAMIASLKKVQHALEWACREVVLCLQEGWTAPWSSSETAAAGETIPVTEEKAKCWVMPKKLTSKSGNRRSKKLVMVPLKTRRMLPRTSQKMMELALQANGSNASCGSNDSDFSEVDWYAES